MLFGDYCRKNWCQLFNHQMVTLFISFTLVKLQLWISITRNRNIVDNQYKLHGQILETVSLAKYLGFIKTSDIRRNNHITNISSEANRSLGFLRRNLQVPPIKIKTKTTVWDLYTQTQIDKLEIIQRRAARYVLHGHHNVSSVTDMIRALGLRPLAYHRTDRGRQY